MLAAAWCLVLVGLSSFLVNGDPGFKSALWLSVHVSLNSEACSFENQPIAAFEGYHTMETDHRREALWLSWLKCLSNKQEILGSNSSGAFGRCLSMCFFVPRSERKLLVKSVRRRFTLRTTPQMLPKNVGYKRASCLWTVLEYVVFCSEDVRLCVFEQRSMLF